MHTYIHTYVRTYIHTYIHTYMHACMHTYIHTFIIYIHIDTYCTGIIYILYHQQEIWYLMRKNGGNDWWYIILSWVNHWVKFVWFDMACGCAAEEETLSGWRWFVCTIGKMLQSCLPAFGSVISKHKKLLNPKSWKISLVIQLSTEDL